MQSEHTHTQRRRRYRGNTNGRAAAHYNTQDDETVDLQALAKALDPIVRSCLDNSRTLQLANLEFADRQLAADSRFRNRLLGIVAAFGGGVLLLVGYLFISGRDANAFGLLDLFVKVLGGAGIASAFWRSRAARHAAKE